MELILGSQSTSRKLAFEEAGFEFSVMSADIDEKAIRDDNFVRLPERIAIAKAEALLPRIDRAAILITADQVVVCNGELREKPESEQQARDYLRSYDKYPAQTNSAVVATNTETGKMAGGVDIALTFFRSIPDEVIEQGIRENIVMNTAGAFLIEHELLKPYIDRIDGSPDSVMGLPLELTTLLIERVS